MLAEQPSNLTRTLLIDDHGLVRASLCLMFRNIPEIEVVGEAETGWQGVKLARKLQPHLVILDFKLPDISGIEVTQRLLKIAPWVKILILTAETHELTALWCLTAGAHSYLEKSASPTEFKQALTALLYDQKTHSQSTHLSSKTRLYNHLSLREIEIMRMMIRGDTVEGIAQQLYLDPKTVYAYRSDIFKKLNVKNVVALALLAFRQGIMAVEDI